MSSDKEVLYYSADEWICDFCGETRSSEPHNCLHLARVVNTYWLQIQCPEMWAPLFVAGIGYIDLTDDGEE